MNFLCLKIIIFEKKNQMKKLFYLILFIPLLGYSTFYKGTITFNDDTIKEGFIEIPEYYSQKIKFKIDNNSKSEKFEIDIVKKFEIVNSKNDTVFFETIILATPNVFNSEKLNIDKKKSWARVIKKSKISLYSVSEGWSNGVGVSPGATSSTPYSKYYIKKPNAEYAIYFHMILGSSGLTIAVNNFNSIAKTSKIIFNDDCPKILERINKEEFKTKGLVTIVDLYDETCGD